MGETVDISALEDGSSRSPSRTAPARASPTPPGASRRRRRRAEARRHLPRRLSRRQPNDRRSTRWTVERHSRDGVERVEHRSDCGATSAADRTPRRALRRTTTRGSASSNVTERSLFVPRRSRIVLHDAVGLVAAQPALHQRQQHRLAEHQTEAGIEIGQHPLGKDLQARRAIGACGASRSRPATSCRAARCARPSCARCRARATARRPAFRLAGCRAAPATDR